MARDLIPPPSPAGRPQPEGTPRLIELPPEREELVQPYTAPPPPRDLPPSRFRNRFGFLIGALGEHAGKVEQPSGAVHVSAA